MVLAAVFAGALTAMQSYMNGKLGLALGNGVIAAWITFAGALVILTLVVAFSGKSRQGFWRVISAVRGGELKWWTLFGGLAGAFFVVTQSATVALIGVALFTLGVVAGQVTSSVFFDWLGITPSGKISPTLPRIIGSVLAIVSVLVAVWSELFSGGETVLIIFAVASGLVISWQTAANGFVAQESRSAVVATAINFIGGFIALTIVGLLIVLFEAMPTNWPANPLLYFGGLLGLVFIALAAVIVRTIGVLILAMATIAGQLFASVLLDTFAPLAIATITPGVFVGTALAFVAVLVAGWREFTNREPSAK